MHSLHPRTASRLSVAALACRPPTRQEAVCPHHLVGVVLVPVAQAQRLHGRRIGKLQVGHVPVKEAAGCRGAARPPCLRQLAPGAVPQRLHAQAQAGVPARLLVSLLQQCALVQQVVVQRLHRLVQRLGGLAAVGIEEGGVWGGRKGRRGERVSVQSCWELWGRAAVGAPPPPGTP
jgi:hypothetical protein